jgi:mRNA-degrading endonuclease RelE of RelBE toxin-antitoxin system
MTSPHKKLLKRTTRFARDLKPLPDSLKSEAYDAAQRLCETVFHRDLNVRPLTGFKGYFRVVIAKDYRMIFTFDDDAVYLHRIAHRKDVYRRLEL